MRLQQFYQEVANLKDAGFILTGYGYPLLRLHKDGYDFCPITAVYYNLTGKYLHMGIAKKAKLGLFFRYRKVIRAADTSYGMFYSSSTESIRLSLVEILRDFKRSIDPSKSTSVRVDTIQSGGGVIA